MDSILLEAMREVDAMLPDTPPIAAQPPRPMEPGRFYEVNDADMVRLFNGGFVPRELLLLNGGK